MINFVIDTRSIVRGLRFHLLTIALTACASCATGQVTPIDWDIFDKGNPQDSLSLLERDILLNSNRFALTTWYREIKEFDKQEGEYLELGGIDEHDIRAIGSEAFALSVAIKTGIYHERETGVSPEIAKRVALELIRTQALKHKVNTPDGWGDRWQSALWAAYAGAAGWMMWEELSAKNREYVRKMVEYEANRFINYEIPYLRSKNGKLAGSKGDSKSEENSWNSMILQVATAMMPGHPNRKVWMNRNIKLMLSANAMPRDAVSSRKINGKRLKEVLQGSNYNSDGTVTNHGRIHPDYMGCISQTFFAALMYGLARQPTPEAAFFNADIFYKAVVDLRFSSPPYQAPGGTIYVPGSSRIYYPQPNDWGTARKMHFALMDCQASAFGMDRLASKDGKYWEQFHASEVLKMQQRSEDGRTYLEASEDTYKGREEWVAVHAAQAYLTKWLVHQDILSVTNKEYRRN